MPITVITSVHDDSIRYLHVEWNIRGLPPQNHTTHSMFMTYQQSACRSLPDHLDSCSKQAKMACPRPVPRRAEQRETGQRALRIPGDVARKVMIA